VVDQVFADGVMAAGEEGNLQLGANAIRRTDQHRLAESGDLERGAERADIGQDVARKRLAGKFLDGGDGTVCFVDIDAGVTVANRLKLSQISVYDLSAKRQAGRPIGANLRIK
jgi:hypothetical protein